MIRRWFADRALHTFGAARALRSVSTVTVLTDLKDESPNHGHAARLKFLDVGLHVHMFTILVFSVEEAFEPLSSTIRVT